ncbi:MAG: hypothetical protein EZS28_008535 [Streblomastix strix]|uniref:Uncharacterized protein n=1 Tax=Streblomastix strix TaxID=222440 RepID=A0A5J4WP10_9EUKA|nr:MAG: hypothetical protein EZS28_008535 [Streblomastix strix]
MFEIEMIEFGSYNYDNDKDDDGQDFINYNDDYFKEYVFNQDGDCYECISEDDDVDDDEEEEDYGDVIVSAYIDEEGIFIGDTLRLEDDLVDMGYENGDDALGPVKMAAYIFSSIKRIIITEQNN